MRILIYQTPPAAAGYFIFGGRGGRLLFFGGRAPSHPQRLLFFWRPQPMKTQVSGESATITKVTVAIKNKAAGRGH